MKLRKETGRQERWYDDACGTAHALELVGERWALLVMRELMFGPRRFGDLRASLPGISAKVLTQRLEGLEGAGIAARRRLPPPASVQVYHLTPWGAEARTIIREFGRWAARSPAHDPTLPLSPVSLMLSFETMFMPERSRGWHGCVAFRLGADRFRADVADTALTIARSEADAPATVTATPEQVAAVVYGGAPPGLLTIEGDAKAFEAFARLFALPPKVDPDPLRSQ